MSSMFVGDSPISKFGCRCDRVWRHGWRTVLTVSRRCARTIGLAAMLDDLDVTGGKSRLSKFCCDRDRGWRHG